VFEPHDRVTRIAYSAVFAAFVAATTMAFTVNVPATRGYFNLGEIMVYTTAILTGPYVGAVAGGVGSAISDAFLGPAYAPGTLVIKGVEGFVVGYMYKKGGSRLVSTHWRALTYLMGLLVAFVIDAVGLVYYTGSAVLTVSLPNLLLGDYPFSVPYYFWLALSVVTFVAIAYRGSKANPRIGWTTLGILVGGACMVAGYFMYEVFALGLSVANALVEMPVNVGQVAVGLVSSLFLTESASAVLRRPSPKTSGPQPA